MNYFKYVVLTTLASSMVLAAPAKVEVKEIARDKAVKIMETREKNAETAKYLKGVAEVIAKAGNLGGLSANLEKALMQGNPDLLVALTKMAEKNDVKAAQNVTELSAGVRSEAEAQMLSKIATMDLDKIAAEKEFLASTKQLVENGKDLSTALKTAAEKYAPKVKMSVEEWLKAWFERC